MSIYRKPGDMLDMSERRDGKYYTGGMAAHCTERETNRGDTWEMSALNVIRKEWAGDDPVRLKQMAATFLHVGCDWDLSDVAIALGYSSGRQGAHVALKAGLRAFRKMFPN